MTEPTANEREALRLAVAASMRMLMSQGREGLLQADVLHRAYTEAMHSWCRSPSPPQAGVDREGGAEQVYEAMAWAAKHPKTHPPKWFPGGNAIAQNEARRCADAILALLPPRGEGASMIAKAFHDGWIDAIKRQPWEDMYDWLALTERDYARAALRTKDQVDSVSVAESGGTAPADPKSDRPLRIPVEFDEATLPHPTAAKQTGDEDEKGEG